MLAAFRSSFAALPHDVAFMLGEGWLHRYHKMGSTTVAVFPGEGRPPVIMAVQQGQEPTASDSQTLRASVLYDAIRPHVVFTPRLESLQYLLDNRYDPMCEHLLVRRDVVMPVEVEEAAEELCFRPHASVFFLGDRYEM